MKKRLLILTIILCFSSFSCAFNNPDRKKRVEALKSLGIAYLTGGYYEKSFKKFTEAQKLDKKDPVIYNCLGLAYMAKKNYNLAIKNFQKAIKLNPEYSEAKNNLGVSYANIKDWDKAIETFKTINKNPEYTTYHYPLTNIGWAYYNKKEYKNAVIYYEQALKTSPNFIKTLYGLGKTYIAIGEYKKAKKLFKKVIEIAPSSVIAQKAEKGLIKALLMQKD